MEEKLKEIEKMRKIPKEVKRDIDKKVHINIIISTIIMACCVLLLMGFKNIEPSKYISDLRVISLIAIVGSIIIVEIAYKKDSIKLAINAIEVIVMSILILILPYIYIYYFYKFPASVVFICSMLGVYYSTKGIIIIFIERKKYKKSINDIKNIIE